MPPRRDYRAHGAGASRPARPWASRAPRGAGAGASLRACRPARRALPGCAPQKGGGSPCGPERKCARPRGRCGVGRRSATTRGRITRSAAAALGPRCPRVAPHPPPAPALKSGAPACWELWGRRPRALGPRLLSGPGPSGWGHRRGARAPDSQGRSSKAEARPGARGSGPAHHLFSATAASHPFLEFSRPGGNFLGRPLAI